VLQVHVILLHLLRLHWGLRTSIRCGLRAASTAKATSTTAAAYVAICATLAAICATLAATTVT
jgi:hypothetical protein